MCMLWVSRFFISFVHRTRYEPRVCFDFKQKELLVHQYTPQFEMVCWEIQDAVKTETAKERNVTSVFILFYVHHIS